MASIHGTVSTILAAVIMAPCSPCMNWLSWALKLSTPSAVSSLSPQFPIGEPSTSRAAAVSCMSGVLLSTRPSGSTSVSQSSSVTLFHCELIALL